MTKGRFAEEFKQEAVWQVVERGYTVSDVATRLGVSVQSLYKWVKAYEPPRLSWRLLGLSQAAAAMDSPSWR